MRVLAFQVPEPFDVADIALDGRLEELWVSLRGDGWGLWLVPVAAVQYRRVRRRWELYPRWWL